MKKATNYTINKASEIIDYTIETVKSLGREIKDSLSSEQSTKSKEESDDQPYEEEAIESNESINDEKY